MRIDEKMANIDTKLMFLTLACLCKSGEQPIYPVYGVIRQKGKTPLFSAKKLHAFVTTTNMNRLMVAEFSVPGVLIDNISIPLENIRSVEIEKTLLGDISVKIVSSNNGKNDEINLTFAKKDYGNNFPYQNLNLDGLLGVLKNREKFCEANEKAMKDALSKKEEEKPLNNNEKSNAAKVYRGPDPVAMMNKEKEYVLSLCERLEAKYGKAEFGSPLTESEILRWENSNQITIPDDLKEWLKFAGESRFKGILLEFYPIERFQKEQDFVVIGRRGNLPIAFVVETQKYIILDGNNRKNLGYMETILRFWGYDAKELFKDEEIEKIQPVIDEEIRKMNIAKQKAMMQGANVKEAMEYFLTKNNIGYLYQWQTFPKCPIRKNMVDCGLVISEPDREGYYQWQAKEQTDGVDFSAIECKLGFSLHKDIKELVSSYFYFMLEGEIEGKSFHINGLLPTSNIEKYVTNGFEKENYAGDYDYILAGHFFHLGGACIDGDDSFVLEVNNDNGEILAVEYMDKKHIKFADSLYDLFMNSTPIWYQD